MLSARGRFRSLFAAGLLVMTVTTADADVAGDAVRFLEAQGYEIVMMERTLLGRLRIEAERGDLKREMVLDRSSGEILRDLVIEPRDDSEREGSDGGGFWESIFGGGDEKNTYDDKDDKDDDRDRDDRDDRDDNDDNDRDDGNSGRGGGDDNDRDNDRDSGNSGRGGGDRDD